MPKLLCCRSLRPPQQGRVAWLWCTERVLHPKPLESLGAKMHQCAAPSTYQDFPIFCVSGRAPEAAATITPGSVVIC